jgi:hypothetical protein
LNASDPRQRDRVDGDGPAGAERVRIARARSRRGRAQAAENTSGQTAENNRIAPHNFPELGFAACGRQVKVAERGETSDGKINLLLTICPAWLIIYIIVVLIVVETA